MTKLFSLTLSLCLVNQCTTHTHWIVTDEGRIQAKVKLFTLVHVS